MLVAPLAIMAEVAPNLVSAANYAVNQHVDLQEQLQNRPSQRGVFFSVLLLLLATLPLLLALPTSSQRP